MEIARPALAVALAVLLLGAGVQDPRAALEVSLAEAGVQLDLEGGYCAIPAQVLVREELLEYLLVGPSGSAHESLFLTHVVPSVANTALLALGLEPGTNAAWSARQDAPGEGPEIVLPSGAGVFMYALWEEREETYFFRAEDLLRNLASGRTMQRHRWTYLGSRFAPDRDGGDEVFVADREQNLVNVTFFREGNTLVTAGLPECLDQTIWVANTWLLPERGWPVLFLFSREPLPAPPPGLRSALRDLPSTSPPSPERR